MFPPLPLESANALELMQELESRRELPHPDRGLMFGVLARNNPAGDGEVVLKAFSGRLFGRWQWRIDNCKLRIENGKWKIES